MPLYNYKHDTVSFSANNKMQQVQKKQGLSNGAIAPDKSSIVLNKDVLLSSIATALKDIKPEEINMEFVNRALSGETIAKCNIA